MSEIKNITNNLLITMIISNQRKLLYFFLETSYCHIKVVNVYIQVLMMPKYSLDELRLIQDQTNKIKKR